MGGDSSSFDNGRVYVRDERDIRAERDYYLQQVLGDRMKLKQLRDTIESDGELKAKISYVSDWSSLSRGIAKLENVLRPPPNDSYEALLLAVNND